MLVQSILVNYDVFWMVDYEVISFQGLHTKVFFMIKQQLFINECLITFQTNQKRFEENE